MGTFAMRRDTVQQVGGLRRWFRMANDVDFQFRLAEVGHVWYEPRVAYCYRLHDDSITHQVTEQSRSFEDRAAQRFAQQRRQFGADDLMKGTPPRRPPDEAAPTGAASEQVQAVMLGRAWREKVDHGKLAAITIGLRACLVRPSNVQTWRSWLALTLRG
jgi:hypothetical protein